MEDLEVEAEVMVVEVQVDQVLAVVMGIEVVDLVMVIKVVAEVAVKVEDLMVEETIVEKEFIR